jgi:hypothetical protein
VSPKDPNSKCVQYNLFYYKSLQKIFKIKSLRFSANSAVKIEFFRNAHNKFQVSLVYNGNRKKKLYSFPHCPGLCEPCEQQRNRSNTLENSVFVEAANICFLTLDADFVETLTYSSIDWKQNMW